MPVIQLRPFQQQALDALHSPLNSPIPQGNHVICVAPTGSGKSLIYQKAAGISGRKTVLITPLLALARQQFQNLTNAKLTPVKLWAGGGFGPLPSLRESGIWILSPENLLTESRWRNLVAWKPDLLVVDECHCLWEWGEGFRPAFLKIPEILNFSSIRRSLWLTATLPISARENLRKILPKRLFEVGRFSLPENLRLSIHRVPLADRSGHLLSWLSRQNKAGIIFVNTRSSAERLARLIAVLGKKTVCYHGGLSQEERHNIEATLSKGSTEFVVATSAFGMGMHYPHLGFVVLWQSSTSILSLVQKIGRAGRNPDQVGEALVFWDYEDFQLMEWVTRNSERKKIELMDLLLFLKDEFECRNRKLALCLEPDSPVPPRCGRCDFCSSNANKFGHDSG